MKCLVTGATGFLGRHLCRALRMRGDEVVELDSRTFGLHSAYIKRYDVIFHLAAWTEAGDFCLEHQGDQWLINQKINTDMLQRWKDLQPQAKLVAVGSSCSYHPGPDLKETDYLIGQPHESLYAYAMTKRMLYVGLQSMHKQFGLNYLYVVPSALYGPDYHTDGRKPHFIFDLMRKIIRGKELGEEVVLWGDGAQVREVIYIDDFVQTLLALNEKCENNIFNIGTSEFAAISYFSDMICGEVGYDPTLVKYDVKKYVGSEIKYLSNEKIMNTQPIIGISLNQGIRKTIAWFYESGAWR